MCKCIVVESGLISKLQILERFQTAKVTIQITRGHRQSCHSI